MSQLLQALLSHPQLIIALIFLGAPVVKAIMKGLQKNKDERTRRQAMERARAEALRTGRPEPVSSPATDAGASTTPTYRPPTPATQAAGAVAARRRMEEMAARRAAAQRSSSAPRSSRIPSQPAPIRSSAASPQPASAPAAFKIRLPNGMEINLPAPVDAAPQREAQPTPQPAAQSQPARREKRARRDQRRQAEPVERSERAPSPEPQPEMTAASSPTAQESRAAAAAGAPAPQRSGTRFAGSPWRKAIIMAEVLGTPVGLR